MKYLIILGLFLSGCSAQVNQPICFKASEYTGCNPSVYVFEGIKGDPLYVCKSISAWKKEAVNNSDIDNRIIKPIESRCN